MTQSTIRMAFCAVLLGTAVVDTVSRKAIGAKVAVEYWRDGQPGTADVKVGELGGGQEKDAQAAGTEGRIGVGVQTLTESISRSLGLPPSLRGVVVTDVQSSSPAAAAGLAPGDVILEMDSKPVRSAAAFADAIRAGGRKGHLLRVPTGNGTRFVTVTPRTA